MGIVSSSLRCLLHRAADDQPVQTPSTKAPIFLPNDVVFDILPRVPVKSLCRFRCVSTGWRALISDPAFVASRKCRRRPPEQLLVVGSNDDMSLRLVDMDGSVVRVINGMERRWTPVCTSPGDGVLCVTTGFSKERLAGVMDLATMKMLVTRLESDRAWGYGRAVPSGDRKVVRFGLHCEVLTVGSVDGGGWRRRKCYPFRIDSLSRDNYTPAVDGMLHFLPVALPEEDRSLLCFDLEGEESRRRIKGPPKVKLGRLDISLGELNGSVCLVEPDIHNNNASSFGGYTNIWILIDREESAWVQAYRIPLDTSTYCRMMPLRILDDGSSKLLFYSIEVGEPLVPHIYDPNYGTVTYAMEKVLRDHVSSIGFCSLDLESFLSAKIQCPVSSYYVS